MSNPRIQLEPDTFYHIYNHAIAEEDIFRERCNYYHFLMKMEKYILPVCKMYAYTLMPNHFHFVLKINSDKELDMCFEEKINNKLLLKIDWYKEKPKILSVDQQTELRIKRIAIVNKLINEQFSNFFNSYVQAYNAMYSRKGALLIESFRRKVIDSDDYLRDCICYVHNNPVLHGFVQNRQSWEFSSFNSYLYSSKSWVQTVDGIALFGGIENFLFVHDQQLNLAELEI